MSVEIEFPVEMMVKGVPLSQGASTASKDHWKERIRQAAREDLPDVHFAADGPVKVLIYYFADAPMNGDLDNIVKPILDSFSKFIYRDDKQVERFVAQKFEPGRLFTFASPSPKLAETIGTDGPRVYLQIDVSAPGEVS
jgi:Holliday junction resolvase RusA-like endonuclease